MSVDRIARRIVLEIVNKVVNKTVNRTVTAKAHRIEYSPRLILTH